MQFSPKQPELQLCSGGSSYSVLTSLSSKTDRTFIDKLRLPPRLSKGVKRTRGPASSWLAAVWVIGTLKDMDAFLSLIVTEKLESFWRGSRQVPLCSKLQQHLPAAFSDTNSN